MARGRTGNIQEFVYSSLRDNILSLNLPPGTAISENEVSLRYRVSRTPVREAFIALSKDALVTILPQKGSMVSRIDFARVDQEAFMRESLEMAALRAFAKNPSAADLAELERCIDLQSEAGAARKFDHFLQYDDRFHRVFFGTQKIAWEALENSCGHYRRVRLLTIWLLEVVEGLVQEHRMLLQAVASGNLRLAMKILKSHLRKLNTEEGMLQRLFPDYFVNPAEETQIAVDFGGLVMD